MELQMSTKTKSEGFERVHIPEEVYDAELKEVKDISEGQYGQRVAFIYKVTAKETVECVLPVLKEYGIKATFGINILL